jgi:hypothetical protein
VSLRAALKTRRSAVIAYHMVKNAAAGVRASMGNIREKGFARGDTEAAQVVSYAQGVFDDYVQYGRLSTETLRDAHVLEIGPGDTLAVAALFLAFGAARVDCLDRFQVAGDDDVVDAVLSLLRGRYGATLAGLESLDPAAQSSQSPIRLRYGALEDAARVLDPEGYEIVVSRAVLEHVYDPEAALAVLDGSLALGGASVHKVDLRDHGVFSGGGQHPLTFLTVPQRTWRMMSQHTGLPNRLRIDWYLRVFDSMGYDVDVFVTHVVGREEPLVPHVPLDAFDESQYVDALDQVNSIRERLVPPFSALDQRWLVIDGFFVAACKRA